MSNLGFKINAAAIFQNFVAESLKNLEGSKILHVPQDYFSIQFAVDIASVSSSTSNPFLICIDPGTYTENVTIDAPGITIKGKGSEGPINLSVVLSGDITYGVNSGISNLDNIMIVGPTGSTDPVLTLRIPVGGGLYMQNCTLDSSARVGIPTILHNGSGGIVSVNNSIISDNLGIGYRRTNGVSTFSDTSISGPFGEHGFGCVIENANSFQAEDCDFQFESTVDQTSTTKVRPHIFENCNIRSVNLGGNSSPAFTWNGGFAYLQSCAIENPTSNGVALNILSGSTGSIDMYNGIIDCSTSATGPCIVNLPTSPAGLEINLHNCSVKTSSTVGNLGVNNGTIRVGDCHYSPESSGTTAATPNAQAVMTSL